MSIRLKNRLKPSPRPFPHVIELVRLVAGGLPASIDLFGHSGSKMPDCTLEYETTLACSNIAGCDCEISAIRLEVGAVDSSGAVWEFWSADFRVGDRLILNEAIDRWGTLPLKFASPLSIKYGDRISFVLSGPAPIDGQVRIELDLIGLETHLRFDKPT